MRSPPLYAGFLALTLFGSATAFGDPVCTLPTPDVFVERPVAGAIKSIIENVDRRNVVVKTQLTLREPVTATLEEGVRAAKAEELEALGKRADFELVRDGALPDAVTANRLLVYRYRLVNGGPVILRYHAVFFTGFRVVHAVGESQATIIDALELPYREAGLHEKWLRRAMQALRCRP
jgi:hypothetical protein